MDQQEPSGTAFFASVPERNTGDQILRTTQQHHVTLSAMADNKASIIITVSSIVLTLCFGKLDQPELRLSIFTLASFTLLALLLAVLTVLPKYRPLHLKPDAPLPPHFNLLFFGHFSELPRDRFLAEMARTMGSDGSIYLTMAKDIYSLGWYLAHHKYRYLRFSYLSFLTGFIAASVEQLWRLIVY